MKYVFCWLFEAIFIYLFPALFLDVKVETNIKFTRICYLSTMVYKLSMEGAGRGPCPAAQNPGKDFPRPIIPPGDIDGERRWEGARKPRDGWWKPFPTADHPPGGY